MSSELELDELYRELILDHYKHPHHREKLNAPDVTAEGFNPVCGDEIEMELKFAGDRLEAIGVRGRGCSISQASSSMMTDAVKGQTKAEAMALLDAFKKMMMEPETEPAEDLGDLEALQGVAKFAVRVKCATLAWHTLGEGLDQHEKGDGTVRVEEL